MSRRPASVGSIVTFVVAGPVLLPSGKVNEKSGSEETMPAASGSNVKKKFESRSLLPSSIGFSVRYLLSITS